MLFRSNHQPFRVLTQKEIEALVSAGKVFPPPEGESAHYPSLDPFFMGAEDDIENIKDLEEY